MVSIGNEMNKDEDLNRRLIGGPARSTFKCDQGLRGRVVAPSRPERQQEDYVEAS